MKSKKKLEELLHQWLTDFGLSKVGLIKSTNDLSSPAVSGTSLLGDNGTQSSLSSPSPSPSLCATGTQQERRKNRSAVGQLQTIWHPRFFWEMDMVCTSADWWSVGVILFELIVGIPPFNAEHPQMIFDNILNRNIPWPVVPDEMNPDAQDLIDQLLIEDPNQRLGARGATEVKQHPYFRDINWDTLARQKGHLKSRGYSRGLRSSEICTPEMKTSYDCENPKESESPRFQAILWVTSAPRKRYPADIKSFSHELNSKGVRPFLLWKPRGLNNVEVLSMIRGKFDKAKEEVDADLHIFAGDLLEFHKESRLAEDELVLQLRQSLHLADKRIPPIPSKPSSSSSSRKSFSQEQHGMLEPKKEKLILKAHPSMSCRTRFGPKSDQGMSTSSAGSMTPRSPLMTPKTSQIDLLLVGKGAYSEHDGLPQMNELADIARCAGNTPLDDDRSLSYLLTCLDDLRVVIDRRKEKYLQMCEMVDDEKVDITSTVIDEDAPLEDDVVRSLRTSPIHSENKDRTSIDDFEIIKPISRGAFGRVFLAKKRTTRDLFAIKVLKKADMIRKNAVESILAERDILISVLNPFVVRFFYSFTCRENLYLVMEYVNGGDLYSLLRNLGCLDEDVARIYIVEVFLLWSIYILCVWFTVRQPDPSTPNLKIDLLAEISRSPCILPEVDASLKTKRMKNDVDEYLKTRPQGTSFLSELKQKLLISPIPVIVASTAPFDKQPEVDGAANIKVAGTDMNNKSSQSHSVFTCWFSKRSSIAINQLKFRSPMA
ncbi:hypothetical protein Lser_V15G29604 [Lactuca serriola]